jgi:hypothetical protein
MSELNAKNILKYKLPSECRTYLENPETKVGIIEWHIIGNLICDSVEEYKQHMSEFEPISPYKKLPPERVKEMLNLVSSKNFKISLERAKRENAVIIDLLFRLYTEIENDSTLLSQGN